MTVNHDVVGSSPTGGVIMTRMLRDQHFLFAFFRGLLGLLVNSSGGILANILREASRSSLKSNKI